ncbi:MAG: SMR family transporter [Verrucomicrobiota bacterium]
MTTYMYLAIAIIGEVIATSALKPAAGFSKLLPSILVIAGYGTAFYFLSLTLRTMPIGIVYALWSGVGVALISVIGWLVFKQSLDLAAIIGITFIVLGVVILNVFSKVSVH